MKRTLDQPEEIFTGFITQFDVDLIEHSEDLVHAVWHVQEKDLNSANIAHGGSSFSVADALCAVLGYKDRHVLTKSTHYYYYSPIVLGDVDIYCRYARKGSYTSLMEAEICQGGKVCMKGFFDMAKMKEAE